MRRLIAWKRENRLTDPVKQRSYGLHYTDPRTVEPDDHRVDLCVSIDGDVIDDRYGIERKTIPRMRCAHARDFGSRLNNRAAAYLFETWLPSSGERMLDYPIIFHYVNVRPNVRDEEAITDVYMPLE